MPKWMGTCGRCCGSWKTEAETPPAGKGHCPCIPLTSCTARWPCVSSRRNAALSSPGARLVKAEGRCNSLQRLKRLSFDAHQLQTYPPLLTLPDERRTPTPTDTRRTLRLFGCGRRWLAIAIDRFHFCHLAYRCVRSRRLLPAWHRFGDANPSDRNCSNCRVGYEVSNKPTSGTGDRKHLTPHLRSFRCDYPVIPSSCRT
jgi:hypothetical protein